MRLSDGGFFHEQLAPRSTEWYAGKAAAGSPAAFLLQGVKRWRDGESHVCRKVLLDAGRAKAHKAGYYVCKSRRVPVGAARKTSGLTSAELDLGAGPRDRLEPGKYDTNIC